MNHLRKFFGLPVMRQRLLLRAFVAAIAAQMALPMFSLRRLQAFTARNAASKPGRSANGESEQDICWAAAVAARYTPGAACMVEALTAQYLLSRFGYCSHLRIGVRRDGSGIAAHAWVELGGNQAETGEAELRYTVLPL
jgi:hypothetical protein